MERNLRPQDPVQTRRVPLRSAPGRAGQSKQSRSAARRREQSAAEGHPRGSAAHRVVLTVLHLDWTT